MLNREINSNRKKYGKNKHNNPGGIKNGKKHRG
jgi:hypothetical protein